MIQRPLPDLGEWPLLDFEQWKATAETLQMYTQIIGKTRLCLTPVQNHYWNAPLHVTARGLTTLPMMLTGGRALDIEFDLLEHLLILRTSAGETRTIKLRAIPVADFYREVMDAYASLKVGVNIDPMPSEVRDPIRFDLDRSHSSYDEEAVGRFRQVLTIADALLKRFSTNFYGKISPVHFFWGSFDLAVSRFNGKTAPHRDDPMQNEAYSHEEISAGFWPGNGGYRRAAFYAYAAPAPEGLSKTVLRGKGGFNASLGEFLLDYSDARDSDDPADTVLQFLEETYSAAADLAGWDREKLDRHDAIAEAVRLKDPQSSRRL